MQSLVAAAGLEDGFKMNGVVKGGAEDRRCLVIKAAQLFQDGDTVAVGEIDDGDILIEFLFFCQTQGLLHVVSVCHPMSLLLENLRVYRLRRGRLQLVRFA